MGEDGKAEEEKKQLETALTKNIEEAAKSCSTLSFAMIVACLFSLITCGSFSDVDLVTNRATTASIPGVGISLNYWGFISVGPILLLAIQLYFLVNLRKFRDLVEDLVKVSYGEGLPFAPVMFRSRLFPSLFMSLFPILWELFPRNSSLSSWLEGNLAIFLAYLAVPISILCIWFRALGLHGSYLRSGLFTIVVLTLSVSVSLRASADIALPSFILLPSGWRSLGVVRFVKAHSAGIMLGLRASLFTPMAILVAVLCMNGKIVCEFYAFSLATCILAVIASYDPARSPKLAQFVPAFVLARWRISVLCFSYLFAGLLLTLQANSGHIEEFPEPRLCDGYRKDFVLGVSRAVVYFQTARLGNTQISKRPLPASGDVSDVSIGAIPEAILMYRNLRYMNANASFCIYCKLDGSDLSGAQLSRAHFERSSFFGSTLNGSYLQRAHFSGASFVDARLKEAYLDGADLSGTNLTDADLSGADVSGADLTSSKLTKDQLVTVKMVDGLTKVSPPLFLDAFGMPDGSMSIVLRVDSQNQGKRWSSSKPSGEAMPCCTEAHSKARR